MTTTLAAARGSQARLRGERRKSMPPSAGKESRRRARARMYELGVLARSGFGRFLGGKWEGCND